MRTPVIACVAALTAGLALAGCATKQTSPEQAATPPVEVEVAVEKAVEKAQAALDREAYEHAVSLFQQALRQAPEHGRARLGLAESYLGLGAYEDALRAFRTAGGDPDVGVRALQGKGIALLLLGRDAQAQEALLAAVEQDPGLWRAWNALANAYDGRRQWDKAEAAYRDAMAAAPEDKHALIQSNWGMSLLTQGRYDEAMSRFNTALEHDAGLRTARTNLRLALAFQGRYAEAMSGVDSSHRAGALNNMGFVAMMRGDHERARSYFLRALESSPKFHETASKNLQLLASLKQIDAAEGEETAAGAHDE